MHPTFSRMSGGVQGDYLSSYTELHLKCFDWHPDETDIGYMRLGTCYLFCHSSIVFTNITLSS
jgi:hypothetical protein